MHMPFLSLYTPLGWSVRDTYCLWVIKLHPSWLCNFNRFLLAQQAVQWWRAAVDAFRSGGKKYEQGWFLQIALCWWGWWWGGSAVMATDVGWPQVQNTHHQVVANWVIEMWGNFRRIAIAASYSGRRVKRQVTKQQKATQWRMACPEFNCRGWNILFHVPIVVGRERKLNMLIEGWSWFYFFKFRVLLN